MGNPTKSDLVGALVGLVVYATVGAAFGAPPDPAKCPDTQPTIQTLSQQLMETFNASVQWRLETATARKEILRLQAELKRLTELAKPAAPAGAPAGAPPKQ